MYLYFFRQGNDPPFEKLSHALHIEFPQLLVFVLIPTSNGDRFMLSIEANILAVQTGFLSEPFEHRALDGGLGYQRIESVGVRFEDMWDESGGV